MLVIANIDFPRSHSLERLLALMNPSSANCFEMDDLVRLSPWAIAGRYPEDIPNPDRQSTEGLIAIARRVIDAAEAIVSGSEPYDV